MTTLQVCPVPTIHQLLLPECPVLEFGPTQQLLFMQLLQQLRVSNIQDVCLNLLSELENERKEYRQPRNVRRMLELQCLFHIQLQMKLRILEERRKHYEHELKKLEEQNVLDLEEAEERISNFLQYLNKSHVNIIEDEDINVLTLAAAFGSPLLVSKLISRGANIHSRDKYQSTPLSWAASRGRSETVKLLIKLGADVIARDKKGFTPLHDAAMSGCVETTTALLENGHGIEIDARSNYGYTPLYAAANHGHLQVLELLLKYGADINARDKEGNNALMTAVDIGNVDVVCWLMQNIKPIDMRPNAEDVTPLDVAVRDKNLEIIKCLLENGFPIKELDDITSPLMEAVEGENVEVVKLLLKFGAEVNHRDENGVTPLLRAAQKNHFKIVQLLVQNGADLLAVDQDGRTAEEIAKYEKYRYVEQFLKNARRMDGSEM